MNRFEQRLMLNRRAFDTVKRNFILGMSERDIKNQILAAWSKPEMPFSGDIAADGRIEGDATDYVLKRGDTLILDLQPGYGGCFADTTRTFFVGEPTTDQRDAYAAVRFALNSMEKMLSSRPKASEVYFAMQDALGKFGFSCPHHAGHALGTEKLLEPRLIPECDTPLENGMIIALEPGVYLGDWGIRLENNYLIEGNGVRELFGYSLDIQDFII